MRHCMRVAAVLAAAAAAAAAGAAAAGGSSGACVALTINATSAASTFGPHYASWNIDPSRDRAFFDTDWAAPRLVRLLSAIGGGRAHLRFGGTGENFLSYNPTGTTPCPPASATAECLNSTTWRALTALSAAAQAPLIFGLNIFPAGSPAPPAGPWNPANARSLLVDARARGVAVGFVELGNEVNDAMSARQQADAYAVLSVMLDSVYGAGAADRPRLVGPDTHSLHDAGESSKAILAYLAAFTTAVGPALHAVTHHEYIEVAVNNVLNATFLDQSANIAAGVVAAIRAVSPTVEVWAGEIGPHNGGTTPNPNCADNKICGRYGSAIWYADSMSAKARYGYQQYCRQDVVGADYALLNTTAPDLAPSPDYYVLRLWHALVAQAPGSRVAVLDVAAAGSALRAYAYCPAAAGRAVNVTLLLINLDAAAPACVAAPGFAAAGAPLALYALTPGAGGLEAPVVLLNGAPLVLDAQGDPPAMPPAMVPQASGITLPPMSIAFVVVPTAPGAVSACA